MATVLPDHKKQLTILVISFFRLFNFLFGVPLGGNISKGDLPPQIKNPSIIFNEEFFKKIWKLYPSGISYIVNYYLNFGSTEEIDNHDLIETDFIRIMEEIVSSFLDSKAMKLITSKMPERIDIFNFNEYAISYPEDGKVMDNSIEYAVSLLSITSKIEIMIKCLTASFENDKIYSLSDKEIVVYRGIVGYTINDKDIFLKPARSFISTSTLEPVAIQHTYLNIAIDKPISNKQNLNDNFIIEMRIPPGIKYIDYNQLITGDTSNEWQKELIFPPGIQFNEIGISKVFHKELFNNGIEKTSEYNKLIVEITNGPGSSFGKTNEFKKTIEYLLSL